MSVADYLKPYHKAHAQHGGGFDVTLWANEQTQRRRFDVFFEMLDFDGKRVLDAGCSRADFAAFLIEKDAAYERYIGIDGVCEVIEHARARGFPRCEFHCGDLLAQPRLLAAGAPQLTVISGTLNTMKLNTAVKVLDLAWTGCGEALAFNFLSDRCDRRAPRQAYPAHRLPTAKLLDWALKKSWDVRFRQDYFAFGHDATIVIRKHSS